MPTFEVTYSGLTELVASFEAMKERVPGAVQEMMNGVGRDTKESMDSFTHVRTGRLKEGNTLTEIEGGFELRNDVYYAKFVEFGTRKMEARPYLAPAVEVGIQLIVARAPTVFEE